MAPTTDFGAQTMNQPLQLALADCKVAFARNLPGFYVTNGCAVFNAPRPLLGKEHPCNDWCHGRFYVEVNLSDPVATVFIKRNIDLDARVVFSITDAELVEMLLVDNKYADRYRERAFEDQLEMLLPNLSNIQNLPYAEALALLDAARAGISVTA